MPFDHKKNITVRFAPANTGRLHLGSLRIALYNWIYARQHGAQSKFILRIEDTDKKRSQDIYTADIIETLEWMGLKWDDDIVFQSTRQVRHKEVALELLEKGYAYWCHGETPEDEGVFSYKKQFATNASSADDADAASEPVLRLKAASFCGTWTLHDKILGNITQDLSDLDNMTLLRSNGEPTYMLAVVVDDHDMNVTHILRGADHLSNTFRQVRIYQAMNWEIPEHAHLPIVNNPDGGKLSKRMGAQNILSYREQGYLQEALLNTTLRLGWGYKNQEIFTKEESVSLFKLEKVSGSPACFDPQKLDHLNQYYLKTIAFEDLFPRFMQWVEAYRPDYKYFLQNIEINFVKDVWLVFAERSITLENLFDLFFSCVYMQNNRYQNISKENAQQYNEIALLFYETFLKLRVQVSWSSLPDLERSIRAWCAGNNLKLAQLAQTLRWVLMGQSVTPPLFHMLWLLGYEGGCQRFDEWFSFVKE